MATVNPVVLKEDKKTDGTWNVKIRLNHLGKSRYIKTAVFVYKAQLDKKYRIKDQTVLDSLHHTLKKYRDAISENSWTIEAMDVEEIKEMLMASNTKDPDVDFLSFSRDYIKKLKAAGKDGTAGPLDTVYRSLVDYFKTTTLPVTKINSIFLRDFEEYLRSPRIIARLNQGKIKEYNKPGLGDGGIHNKMRDLRTLFNEARNKYNDEQTGIIKIKHYPFKKYKVGQAPRTKKRNLEIDKIKLICGAVVKLGSRQELARDIFNFSFCMLGINAADVYYLAAKSDSNPDRIEYNRKKTKGRRNDDAFISVKLIEDARYFYSKYIKTGVLRKRYSSHIHLDRAINVGLKEIGLRPEINVPELGYYYARYSVGSLARNSCGFSKDDIGEALNHLDEDHKVTDIYIDFDWSILDRVQSAVVSLLYKD
ncbi:site-specific integrase [Pedobacter sp. B4-66]|uniref:site-specific integrase n=1 Tax=Pedobacter sp. B4-66 TaxID=2817280 RepID=UPI001BDB0530|nr:site-specific integrase [Pedobacter sp. B4-66]